MMRDDELCLEVCHFSSHCVYFPAVVFFCLQLTIVVIVSEEMKVYFAIDSTGWISDDEER